MPQDTAPQRAVSSDKVWATLITNLDYLPGLLTLHHSLRQVRSAYPLVALYTEESGFRAAGGLDVLAARGIPARRVARLAPSSGSDHDFAADPRFADTFSKLASFSLAEYARVVQVDADMLVLRNMDELMDLPLDDPADAAQDSGEEKGEESGRRPRVFAASHVCACNPTGRSHYPETWVRDNCAFSAQAADPDRAQLEGVDPRGRAVAMVNGGLVVLRPSPDLYRQIVDKVERDGRRMYFPDQEVISELWPDGWVALPYVYNALKTMRRPGVHDAIWRDESVKNVHYILSPKPWDELDRHGNYTGTDETHRWWAEANKQRKAQDKLLGITDDY